MSYDFKHLVMRVQALLQEIGSSESCVVFTPKMPDINDIDDVVGIGLACMVMHTHLKAGEEACC